MQARCAPSGQGCSRAPTPCVCACSRRVSWRKGVTRAPQLLPDPLLADLAVFVAALAAAVGEVPGILYAPGAGAGTRGHHALLERGEAAVGGTAVALIHRAPGSVDFRITRADVEQRRRCQPDQ